MPLAWTALVGCGALAGVGLVLSLAVPHRTRIPVVTLGAASMTLSGWGLALIVTSAPRASIALATGALGLASIAAGYGLGASVVSSLRPRRAAVALEPRAAEDPRIGVVVYADVEPRTYSLSETAEVMALVSEADPPPVPVLVAPFLFAAQRSRYQGADGRSPSRDGLRATAVRLAAELDADRFAEPAYAACEGDASLAEAVADLAARGHRTVVAAPLAVAAGHADHTALRAVDALKPRDAGVRVVHADVLWHADEIADLVARRVLLACDGAEDSTGVVLVAHGQPPGWREAAPEFDAREVAFLSRVQSLLTEGGMRAGHVRTAWTAWQEPDVPEAVRHLAAVGCARVLACPACDPVESLDTLLDLPAAVRMARVPVPTRVLSAWGDAPEVARALARRIEKALAESE